MVLAAVTTSVTVIAVIAALTSWFLFWGAISVVVRSHWSRARASFLLLGIGGPLGPPIAAAFGLFARSRARRSR